MLSKKLEYIVAGVLALYIVFATRPAPSFVTALLSSPVAQVAGLAAVIWVGATQSLVVAIVGGLALVLSTPSREHMTAGEKDKHDKKKPAAMKPKPAKGSVAAASKQVSAPAKPAPAAEEPEPAGHTLKAATEKGSESFTVGRIQAADF
jgi:hypothetical protein